MLPTAEELAAWRAEIPLLESFIPMNNCSQGPQTLATRAAAARYLESWNTRGMDWEAWLQEVHAAKAAFASLINATVDDVAVFSSVSHATSAVASALDFSRRAAVLTTEAEFPTIAHIWLAQETRGARVAWVPMRDGQIDVADVATRLTRDTSIVSVCHGSFLNGCIQDVPRIAAHAHQRDALVFVDAYQTIGAVPIDVRAMDIDFLAAGCLKYLMGSPGIAFLYARPELVQRLQPTTTGWLARAQPFSFSADRLDWSDTASRFDSGTPPILNAYIARAGMEILTGIGVERVREWHVQLGRHLIDGGKARGLVLFGSDDMSRKTANTAFVVPDTHAVEDAMRRAGIIASARGPVIRLAPHYFSTFDDVDRALDVLAEILA